MSVSILLIAHMISRRNVKQSGISIFSPCIFHSDKWNMIAMKLSGSMLITAKNSLGKYV